MFLIVINFLPLIAVYYWSNHERFVIQSYHDTYSNSDASNVRSKKVAESLNFHLESISKSNCVYPSGEIGDTCIYVRYDLENLPSLDVNW